MSSAYTNGNHEAAIEEQRAKNGNHEAAIEEQRAKASFVFREALSPEVCIEMILRRILISTQSPFQKVDVIETCFGKVNHLRHPRGRPNSSIRSFSNS